MTRNREEKPTHEAVRPVNTSEPVGSSAQEPPRNAPAQGEAGLERIPEISRSVLERVRARDPAALAALFDRYFERVYSVAYRLVGEHASAEDVVQEVFLKVHRAAHRIDPARDPAPWLLAITHNACRDVWRSAARRMASRSSSIHDPAGLGDDLVPDRDNPERRVVAREREHLVQAAISRLPEALRTVVILHEYDGMSHDEIAAATGSSHAAVRKRHSRAVAALGKMLKHSLRGDPST